MRYLDELIPAKNGLPRILTANLSNPALKGHPENTTFQSYILGLNRSPYLVASLCRWGFVGSLIVSRRLEALHPRLGRIACKWGSWFRRILFWSFCASKSLIPQAFVNSGNIMAQL